MSKKNGRRFFSDEDGTKIGEDFRALVGDIELKLQMLFKKWGAPAERIIDALRFVSEQIQEGTPVDTIIDRFTDMIEGEGDDALYAYLQTNLPAWVKRLEEIYAKWQAATDDIEKLMLQGDYESARHKTASIFLQDFAMIEGEVLDRVDTDTVIQDVYRLTRDA